jgi:hypothetical protein
MDRRRLPCFLSGKCRNAILIQTSHDRVCANPSDRVVEDPTNHGGAFRNHLEASSVRLQLQPARGTCGQLGVANLLALGGPGSANPFALSSRLLVRPPHLHDAEHQLHRVHWLSEHHLRVERHQVDVRFNYLLEWDQSGHWSLTADSVE